MKILRGNVRTAFSHFAGFTLIELLVVVAIIAILASLFDSGVGEVEGNGDWRTLPRQSADLAHRVDAIRI